MICKSWGLGQSLGAEMAIKTNLCLKGSVGGAGRDHPECLVENHLDKLSWPIPLLSCNYVGLASCEAFENRIVPVGSILSSLFLGDTGLGTYMHCSHKYRKNSLKHIRTTL